jgi:catechol 2,3-dioxygenase-like lactoylglutathione lyase family enzyme
VIRKLDSVVFDTADLSATRRFYAEVLGLAVGTFERDGKTLPDESDRYVNFKVGDTLLGFEAAQTAQTGTIVLQVESLPEALAAVAAKGVRPHKARENFAIIRDPEGRELILQA